MLVDPKFVLPPSLLVPSVLAAAVALVSFLARGADRAASTLLVCVAVTVTSRAALAVWAGRTGRAYASVLVVATLCAGASATMVCIGIVLVDRPFAGDAFLWWSASSVATVGLPAVRALVVPSPSGRKTADPEARA